MSMARQARPLPRLVLQLRRRSPSLDPLAKVGLSPCDGSGSDSHLAGELLRGHHAIDGRSAQTGPSNDSRQAEQGWWRERCLLVLLEKCCLHAVSPLSIAA